MSALLAGALLAVAAPQALQLVLEEKAPVDATLVLDMSRSVSGPKLDALKDAARAFLDGLHEGEQAALLAFREEVLLLEPFTSDRARRSRSLAASKSRPPVACATSLRNGSLRSRPRLATP